MNLFRFRTFHNDKGPMRVIESIVLVALFFSIGKAAINRTVSAGKQIRTETLRLHIIANSDSEADQALKLKVRDRILEVTGELFAEAKGKTEAEALAQISLDDIKSAAEEVIAKEGKDYPVAAEITKMWFETRSYEGFTLPAGDYDAVRIIIGAGEGANWWCVMYPQLCVPGAEGAEEKYGENSDFVKGGKYEIRFAVVELYEKIRRSFEQ